MYLNILNIEVHVKLLTNLSKIRRKTNSVEVVIKNIFSRNNRFLLVLHVLREYY